MTQVGKRIRDLRVAKGLTLPQLAKKAGITKGYLWQIENSEDAGAGSRPSAETLRRIAESLEVGISGLVDAQLGAPVAVDQVVSLATGLALTPSLHKYIKACKRNGEPLDEQEIWMLAGIGYRGKVPRTVEDWDYIMESIKRVVG